MRRFVAVEETAGSWAVHDAVFGLPADVDGKLAVGLSKEEAIRAAAHANARILRWRPGMGTTAQAGAGAFGRAA